jgi:subtilase family serine protease
MRRRLGATLVSVALLGGFVATATAASAAPAASGFHVNYGADGESDVNVCSTAQPAGVMHCLAHRRTDAGAANARPARVGRATTGVIGNNGAYDPSYLQSAYNVPATHGAGQTVAIVDAYDDPNAEADLAAYRTYYGLSACTTANGCFEKVNQNGAASPLPAANVSWSEEISLDLDMVSAICPNCKILLVEGNTPSIADLGTSVNTAVSLGANAVSNSYGGGEFSGEATYANQYYNHPGVAITVSSGDDGYGVEFPAAAATVTAVGGTSLKQTGHTGTRNATERAWSGAGSGCSAYIAKPTWQKDTGCTRRTVADVAAVADPNTGVWVYDTYGTGFTQAIFGGTSAAAPIVAAMYALAQNPASSDTLASYPYAGKSFLNDIAKGTNGTCSPAYLCTGVVGYDGPTGLGTPNGTTAFAPSSGASVPGQSTLVAVTSTTSGVDLSWNAPAANGSPITSYQLYRAGVSGSEKALISVPCTLGSCTYTDALVPTGKRAYYQIAAVNGVGMGARSVEVSAVGK